MQREAVPLLRVCQAGRANHRVLCVPCHQAHQECHGRPTAMFTCIGYTPETQFAIATHISCVSLHW